MEKKRDILHTQGGLEENQPKENSSEKELFKRKTLTNNGIMVVGNDDRGYFAAIGLSRISEVYKTHLEVEELVKDKDWEILGAYVATMIENYMKLREEERVRAVMKYDESFGKPDFQET